LVAELFSTRFSIPKDLCIENLRFHYNSDPLFGLLDTIYFNPPYRKIVEKRKHYYEFSGDCDEMAILAETIAQKYYYQWVGRYFVKQREDMLMGHVICVAKRDMRNNLSRR